MQPASKRKQAKASRQKQASKSKQTKASKRTHASNEASNQASKQTQESTIKHAKARNTYNNHEHIHIHEITIITTIIFTLLI